MKPTSLTLILLTTALLATAPAQAQTPVDPSVEVIIQGGDQAGPSLDDPATYSVTIRNTSPGTGSPLDQPQDIVLEVSGVPAGWNAAVNPSHFELPSGQEASATLTVSVSANAASETAEITITAFIEQGASPPLQVETEGSNSITVMRDDSPRRDAVETLDDYLGLAIGVSLLLFVLSTMFLIMLFRQPLSLHADTTSKRIRRGKSVSFPFTVTNHARDTEVVLRADGDIEGWGVFVNTPEVPLNKGESTELVLTVQAPQKVPAKTVYHATVTASAGNEKRTATLTFDATIG